MKKQIFSSKIVYFSIFLIFICFSFWGIKNVGATVPDVGDQINVDKHMDMQGHKIINLGTPEEATDAATKSYIDSIATGTGSIGLWMDGTTYIYPSNVPANSFVILDTGYVGIGSSAPSQPLQVVANSIQRGIGIMTYSPTSAGSTSLDFYTQANRALGSQIVGLSTNTGELGIYTNTGATLGLYQNASGYIGIGTTIPLYKLDVRGEGSFGTASSTNQIHYVATPTASSDAATKGYADSIVTGGAGLAGSYWTKTASGDHIYNNNSGNVGIGTTVPSTPLHIKSTSSPQLKIEYDAGRYVTIDHAGDITNNDNTGANPMTFTTGGSGAGDHDIVFVPEGAEAMRIKAGGNVGIGTTIPEGKLSVVGDVGIGAMANTDQASHMLDIASTKGSTGFSAIRALYPSGGGLAGTEFGALANRDSEWKAVYAKAGTGGAIALYTDGEVNMMSGNVGIGTTVPNAKLHVYNTSPNAEIDVQTVAGSGNHWAIYNDNTSSLNALRFWQGSDRVTFTSAGNVGIGTTSPQYPLDLQLSSSFNYSTVLNLKNTDTNGYGEGIAFSGNPSGSSRQFAIIGGTVDGSGGEMQLGVHNGTYITYPVTIRSTGYVGIGTTIPSTNLDINGQIKIRGGVPGANKILISDAVGLATWSPATSINDGDWTISGNDQYSAVSGNVGIGITNPTANLSIMNTSGAFINISGLPSAGTYEGIRFGGQSEYEALKGGIFFKKSTDPLYAANQRGDLIFAVNSIGDNSNVALTDAKMTIAAAHINGAERARVGIGTITPTHALEVIDTTDNGGSPTFQPAGYFVQTAGTGGTGLYGEGFVRGVWGSSRADGGAGFGVYGQVGNHSMCNLDTGLTGGGAVVGIVDCSSGGSPAVRAIVATDGGGYGIFSQGTNSLNYFEGNVGIGTTNPAIKLAIGDTNTGLDWASNDNLEIITNNTERIRIDSEGKVGIGTTSPISGSILDVNGGSVARVYIDNRSGNNDATILFLAGGGTSWGNTLFTLNPSAGTAQGFGIFGTGTGSSFPNFVANADNTYLGYSKYPVSGNQTSSGSDSSTGNLMVKGKVGIGMTNPTTALDTTGTITASGMGRFKGWTVAGEAGAAAEIGLSAGTGYIYNYNRTTSAHGDFQFGDSAGGVLVKTGGNVIVNEGSSNDVDFRVEGATDANALLVDGSVDKVIIGTSGVSYGKLNVNGAISSVTTSDTKDLSTWAAINSNYVFSTGNWGLREGTDHAFNIDQWNGGTEIPAMTIGTTGNVTLNEDSADTDFRVESNDNANMLFVDGGANKVTIGYNGGLGAIFNVYTGTNNTTQFTGHHALIRGGDGSTNTVNELDFGIINTYAPVTLGTKVIDGAGNTKADFYIGTRNVTTDAIPTERLRVTSAGYVGIGITNPTHTLQLGNDDAAKTTTTTWTTTSDGRLKNVVGTYDRGLAEILRINPIRYTYKKNNALGIVVPGEHIGIIAQDVQKVIPEAITVDSMGYLHYNGDPVIWASVNAIKEQQKEITALAGQVDDLKKIVCQLKPDADVCSSR